MHIVSICTTLSALFRPEACRCTTIGKRLYPPVGFLPTVLFPLISPRSSRSFSISLSSPSFKPRCRLAWSALNSEKNNEFLQHSNCPQCKNGMLKIKTDRAGLYDPFLGCSDYPKCKHSQKPVRCPKCQSGDVVRRANKKTNEPFYTCNKFECDYKFSSKLLKRKFKNRK